METGMQRSLVISREEDEAPMSAVMSRDWPALGIFVGAIVVLVGYVAAAIGGWVSWVAWMPAVLSVGFVAWGAAIRIRRIA
jgi:fatty acid desaturase